MNSVLGGFQSVNQTAASVESNPDDLPALAKLAQDFQQKKNYLKSIEIFERILRLESNPIQREIVMLNIGYDYLRAKKFVKAIETFEIMRNEFPEGSQTELALYGEFLAFEKKNQFHDAERSFDKLKMQFPKSSLLRQAEQILPQNNQQKK